MLEMKSDAPTNAATKFVRETSYMQKIHSSDWPK